MNEEARKNIEELMPEQTLKDFVESMWNRSDELGRALIIATIRGTLDQLMSEQECRTIRENYKDYNEGRTSNKKQKLGGTKK